LAVAGFLVVWCGKRRRQAKLAKRASRQQGWTKPGLDSDGPVVNVPQQLYTKWNGLGGTTRDNSPSTAGGYGNDKHSFSPYSSQYSSPISTRDVVALKEAWDWKQASMSTIGEAERPVGPPPAAPLLHLGRSEEVIEMKRL